MNDFVDINLSASGKIIPPKHNKIALIDADTLAYTACLNSEVPIPVMEQDYSESKWLDIINNPSFDSKNMVLYKAELDIALEKAEDKLQRILDLSGCKTQELHFSAGKENFRYKIYKDYKGNRKKGRLPAGLKDLKEILAKKYNGFIHTKIEADDEVVYKMSKNKRKYLLCAVDKDVINSIEGKHFYYYESNIYNKEMEWVTVSKEKSMKWKYIQTLAGDATDNIIGLNKIGLVKAEKLLSGIDYKDKQSIVNVLKREYTKQGRSYKDIILNLNLVDMSLYQGNPNTISLYKHIDKKLLKAKYEF